MKILRHKLDLNQLSLNEKVRKAELSEENRRKEERNAERKKAALPETIAYEVSLDTVDKPELPRVTKKKKTKEVAEAGKNTPKPAPKNDSDPEDAADEDALAKDLPDPVRNEALRILQDFSTLGHSLRTAGIAPAP